MFEGLTCTFSFSLTFVEISVLTLISPTLVLTVTIFLEPKYSTPNTNPLRPPSFVRERFSGRIPKEFFLPLDISCCFGILKSVPSIFKVDCSLEIP